MHLGAADVDYRPLIYNIPLLPPPPPLQPQQTSNTASRVSADLSVKGSALSQTDLSVKGSALISRTERLLSKTWAAGQTGAAGVVNITQASGVEVDITADGSGASSASTMGMAALPSSSSGALLAGAARGSYSALAATASAMLRASPFANSGSIASRVAAGGGFSFGVMTARLPQKGNHHAGGVQRHAQALLVWLFGLLVALTARLSLALRPSTLSAAAEAATAASATPATPTTLTAGAASSNTTDQLPFPIPPLPPSSPPPSLPPVPAAMRPIGTISLHVTRAELSIPDMWLFVVIKCGPHWVRSPSRR